MAGPSYVYSLWQIGRAKEREREEGDVCRSPAMIVGKVARGSMEKTMLLLSELKQEEES